MTTIRDFTVRECKHTGFAVVAISGECLGAFETWGAFVRWAAMLAPEGERKPDIEKRSVDWDHLDYLLDEKDRQTIAWLEARGWAHMPRSTTSSASEAIKPSWTVEKAHELVNDMVHDQKATQFPKAHGYRRVMVGMDKHLIERAAIAMCNAEFEGGWNEVDPHMRDRFRDRAKIALSTLGII